MKNAGMPAMPGHEYGADGNLAKGLTKREHFAALAMQGYVAAGSTGMPLAREIARLAVETADTLLVELEKTS